MTVQIALDYLQGTFYLDSYQDLEDKLSSFSRFLECDWGWSAPKRFKSSCGMYGRILDSQQDSIYLQVFFPGEFCRALSNQLEFAQHLRESSINLTRLDIALDDYDRRVSFEQVHSCGELGNYSGVDYYERIQSKFIVCDDLIPTCYFGKGDKILRFYDAEVVHEILADRWELQLRGNWARVAFSDYLDEFDCLGQHLVGAVDFIDRSANTRYDRCSRFDWWQSIINDVYQGLELRRLPKYSPSLQRSLKWLDSQAGVILSVIRDGCGVDQYHEFLDRLADRGRDRRKSYHDAWVNDLINQYHDKSLVSDLSSLGNNGSPNLTHLDNN